MTLTRPPALLPAFPLVAEEEGEGPCRAPPLLGFLIGDLRAPAAWLLSEATAGPADTSQGPALQTPPRDPALRKHASFLKLALCLRRALLRPRSHHASVPQVSFCSRQWVSGGLARKGEGHTGSVTPKMPESRGLTAAGRIPRPPAGPAAPPGAESRGQRVRVAATFCFLTIRAQPCSAVLGEKRTVDEV